jgi:hypothetical protein
VRDVFALSASDNLVAPSSPIPVPAFREDGKKKFKFEPEK